MTSPTPPRVLLDCDPGHDDALAIVAAARYSDLVGITTVAGNAPLDRTTHNAMVMRDLLGLDVPVHAGSPRPLLAEASAAAFVHGDSGLDGADLPAPTTALDGTDAVSFIIETCRTTADVWLVPVGPLTNIALALRAAPDIAERIAGISLMGGGTFGNRTPAAEFNVWADPEAAAIVFGYGGPLVMAGLDVTHQFQATRARIGAIEALPGRLAAVLADLLRFFSENYRVRHEPGSMQGAAVHDPLAVFAVTHPGLLGRSARHVAIETTGEHTRGMTVIDQRAITARSAPNCDVLDSVNDDAVFDLLVAAVAHFSR
ncbi:MAG TPA: nucleoside hydrolase [Ilumatobacteraceae bacterium]|nr:nucleoside hydrolase [Ilumatobacteraceae bacterium]